MLVTFLHGFGQDGESWREVISLLPPSWRCLAPGLRSATMDACQAELERLWRAEPGHLVGYSMGGRLALHVAARAPARLLSLVTVGAHAGLEPLARERRRAEDEALAGRIERDGSRAFAEHFQSLPLLAGEARRGPEFAERRTAARLAQDPAHLAASLRGMGAGAMEPVWDRLPAFERPALVVAGAEDVRYTGHARRLASVLPGATLAIVPGSGHAVHLERPAEFAALLIEHLSHPSSR